MHRVELSDPAGVRWLPDEATGVGVLVLAGSSGRVDADRAALLARHGAVAESVQWFGGKGQHDGPWEISLELFLERVAGLAEVCDRVIVVGTSFGAEAALLTGAHSTDVDAVVAFAPTDLVWAGVRGNGTMTSHWTVDGVPLPYMPFDETWESNDDIPAFVGLYESSREHFAERLDSAAIPVERIGHVTLVAGADDQVWPALSMAESIRARRQQHGLDTTLISDAEAGHRTVLPGEAVVAGGARMQRGGNETADRRLGARAWPHILSMLDVDDPSRDRILGC